MVANYSCPRLDPDSQPQSDQTSSSFLTSVLQALKVIYFSKLIFISSQKTLDRDTKVIPNRRTELETWITGQIDHPNYRRRNFFKIIFGRLHRLLLRKIDLMVIKTTGLQVHILHGVSKQTHSAGAPLQNAVQLIVFTSRYSRTNILCHYIILCFLLYLDSFFSNASLACSTKRFLSKVTIHRRTKIRVYLYL